MSRIAITAAEKSAANAPGLSDPQLRARAEAACEWLIEIGTLEALDGAARLIAALDAIDAPWEDMESEEDSCPAHDDDPSWEPSWSSRQTPDWEDEDCEPSLGWTNGGSANGSLGILYGIDLTFDLARDDEREACV